jgi:NADP-dependent 3-hydroxy acid dehydrogenase YdfG
MKELNGKVAFVTGGVSGVGLGLSQAFVEAGMRVVMTSRRTKHIDQALRSFAHCPDRVRVIEVDVTDRQGMERAALEAERAFGGIHVLCNNAGVNFFGAIDEATYDDWDWLMQVNVGGVINGIMTVVPRIRRHGEGGHVVNTCSMAGFIGVPTGGVYSTTKFAVRGLTESLRYRLTSYGIGVSLLSPGLVRSNICEAATDRPQKYANTRKTSGEMLERILRAHSVGMEPLEVGRKVVRGIQRGDFYIFTHSEFRAELEESLVEMLAALPEDPADPARVAVENDRRRVTAAMKALALEYQV